MRTTSPVSKSGDTENLWVYDKRNYHLGQIYQFNGNLLNNLIRIVFV